MTRNLPRIYLIRHGETEWTRSGQHTGRTDLPLTGQGEQDAGRLKEWMQGKSFVTVLSSPLQRARRTCELAGLGRIMEIDENLQEWDYGEYEGRRTAEIQTERPGWNLFRDGCPEARRWSRYRSERIGLWLVYDRPTAIVRFSRMAIFFAS